MQDDILSLVTGGKSSFSPAPQPAQPADYSGLISTAEQKYGIPAGLLHAVITKGEASGAAAVSKKGAVGLGQLMPGTAKDMGVTDPTDPAQNIDGAGKYLGQQYAKYGDPRLAVAAYNAGPKAVDDHGGVPPYPETQAYVTRVLGGQPQASADSAGAAAPQNGDVLSLVTGGKSSFSDTTAPSVKQPAANAPGISNDFVNTETYESYNPAQVKTLQQMAKAGMIDMRKGAGAIAGGTATTPYVQTDPDVIPKGPGVYYVDLAGKLQQTPGKPISAGEGLAQGGIKGVEDVGASLEGAVNAVNKFTPVFNPSAYVADKLGVPQDASFQDYNSGQNKLFDARYSHNGYATSGRIGGNIAATAPVMAIGGGALDAAAEGSPIAAFIAGQAGKGLGGAVPNLLLRGGSLATRGALEGAGAAGLTSSASDVPVQNQMLQGAELGTPLAVAGPLIGAAAKGMGGVASGLVDPLTDAGRNKLIMGHLSDVAAGGNLSIVPHSEIPGVTRTLAQSIPGGNAGIAATERAMVNGNPEFNNTLKGMSAANNEARKDYMSGFIAPADAIETAKTMAAGNSKQRLDSLFSSATPTDAPAAVKTLDATLASPAGSSPAVRSALQTARKALVSEESGLVPADRAEFDQKIMAAMGSNAAKPTQDAMQANKDRLGAIFEDVGGKTNIQAGDDFKNALGQVIHEAGQVLPDSEVAPLQKQVQNIVDTIGGDGQISGKSYQALIRKGSPLDRAMAGKGNVGFYAGQLRDVLDTALQDSAAPADVKALQTARTQYRNMKIAEGAINKAAPDAGVDPDALLAGVKKATSNFAYSGGGDLGEAATKAVKAAAPRDVYDTRPETLHEVYDALQKAATRPGAHPALAGAQTALLNHMEASAPGYTKHLAQSAAEQQGIAQQEYLHGLGLTLNDGTPTLNKLNGALKKIGNEPHAPVTADTINKLTTLRDDLAMEHGSNAGMGKGSNTHQNLATAGLSNALGVSRVARIPLTIAGGMLGATHGIEGAGIMGALGASAGELANHVYSAKNALIQDHLRNALVSPETVQLSTRVPAGSFGKDNKILSLLKGQSVPAIVETKNRLTGRSS